MALSVVYFQFTHCLGRPHYVWEEYLYSVLEEVEVRMTVCVTVCIVHGCANHDIEGKRFKFPHPLLWRNEASLLYQWRTNYLPLALFAYTVCCRRTEQCFSVLRTHKSDVVDESSGRRYVTDQWHNVPLLRARGLRGSEKPYLTTVKIVLMKCTFSQELFIVGAEIFYRLIRAITGGFQGFLMLPGVSEHQQSLNF